MGLVGLAMFGIFFYNSLFIQNILGYSAIETGATFLPMTVLIILVAPFAGRLSDRIGPRWLIGAGMTLLTVVAAALRDARRELDLLVDPARPGRRRARDGADDGADHGRGDGLGARRQGRRRLGGDQRDAPGRRLARHRRDGHARRDERHRRAVQPGLPGPVRRGLPPRALRRRGDPARRRGPRGAHGSPDAEVRSARNSLQRRRSKAFRSTRKPPSGHNPGRR